MAVQPQGLGEHCNVKSKFSLIEKLHQTFPINPQLFLISNQSRCYCEFFPYQATGEILFENKLIVKWAENIKLIVPKSINQRAVWQFTDAVVRKLGLPDFIKGAVRQFGPYLSWAQARLYDLVEEI